jgi:hypothetical protein
MRQKSYEVIRNMLIDNPELRSNDRKLIWTYWEYEGHSKGGIITEYDYLKCTAPETITRCRRKVQENHPELQAKKSVKIARKNKERQGGNFVYREEVDYKIGMFK